MVTRDMPDIRHSTYAASAVSPFDAANQAVGAGVSNADLAGMSYLNQVAGRFKQGPDNNAARAVNLMMRGIAHEPEPFTPQQEQPMANAPRRLVQVFIVDPHPDVPLSDCLLHKGEMQLTDATDQELFFEIDLQAILKDHNLRRVLVTDKSVKDRKQYLEPARIRDLRMQIVTVATF